MKYQQARLTYSMEITAFKQLILPAKDRLFRVALSLLKDSEEANDILQEAMLRLWNLRHTLPEYKSPEALALKVTRNLCLDRLKSKNYLNRAGQTEIPDYGSEAVTPHRQLELTDSSRLMRQLFSSLPEQQQTIIRLRDVEDMSYEEIEDITGLSINTIRVNLSRARKTVREKYIKINNYELE